MTNHLYIPCIINQIYPQKVSLIVEILNYLQIDVQIVEDQKCCGYHHLTSGLHEDALHAGEHFIDRQLVADKIIVPSADCVYNIKHHYTSLFKNTSYHLDHKKVQSCIVEFGDFIAEAFAPDQIIGEFRSSILYISPGLLLQQYQIGERHRSIFERIHGIDVHFADGKIEHPGIDQNFYKNFPQIASMMFEAIETYAGKKLCDYIVISELSWFVEFDGYLRRKNSRLKLLTISDLIHASMRGYLP